MAFCPNKNLPEWEALKKVTKFPYTVWSENEGNVDKFLRDSYEPIQEEKAKAWLNKTFPDHAVEFYDIAKQIGNRTVHGYVANGVFNMWRKAEVGTEFHEGYHLAFRTMLSNSARELLYKDAEKQFGKPTAEDLTNVKEEFPDISDAEAYNLALEEKMAEGFVEYMLTEEESGKGLLASIAKWFKDLFNWIRGVISNDVSLKKVYSLLKNSNVNATFEARKVFRNPERMASTVNPNRARVGIPSPTVDEITEGLADMVVAHIKKIGTGANIGEILGNSKTNGTIVKDLLYQLYSFPNTSIRLKGEENILLQAFMLEKEVKKYDGALKRTGKTEYKTALEKAAKNLIEFRKQNKLTLNNFPKVPEDATNRELAIIAETRKRRDYIFNVIENWNGKFEPKTGNTIVRPWREDVETKLTEFGYVVKAGKVTIKEEEEPNAEERELEAVSGVDEKIFDKKHYSESISKRLSQQARAILRTIPILESYEENGKVKYREVKNKIFTDRPKYHSQSFVYKQLLTLWADTVTFTEMEAKLASFAIHRPDFKSINSKVRLLSSSDKAKLYNAFANTIIDFEIVVTGKEGGVYSANSLTTEVKMRQQWRSQAISVGGSEFETSALNRALYVKDFDEDPDKATFTVNEKKVKEITESFEAVERAYRTKKEVAFKTTTEKASAPVVALGNLIWNLGMNIGTGTSVQETIGNLQTLINKGMVVPNTKNPKKLDKPDGKDLFVYIVDQAALYNIVNSIVSIKTGKNGLQIGSLKKDPVPFFDTEKSGVTFLASLTPLFMDRVSENFVSATGSSINPTNLKTPLDDLVLEIKNDIDANGEKALEFFKTDKFHYSDELGFSHLYKHLMENPEFRDQWKFKTIDAIRDSNDDAYDMEDFNTVQNILVRIQQYINNNNSKYYKVVVPTMGDRTRMVFMMLARMKGHNKSTLNMKTHSDVFKMGILQDFLRIKQARDTSTGPGTKILDYNTGKMRGTSEDEFMQFDGFDETGERIVQDFTIGDTGLRMSDYVSEYIEVTKRGGTPSKEVQEFKQKFSRMLVGLSEFYERKAAEMALLLVDAGARSELDIDYIESLAGKIDKKGRGLSKEDLKEKLEKVLKDFLVHEDLGRNEILKITRGNRALYKNLQDFTKRQRLLTTPGSVLLLKGDLKGDPNYGADRTFTDFTYLDPRLDITKAIQEQSRQYVGRSKAALMEAGYTEEQAAKAMDGYMPRDAENEGFEETNAFTVISLDFYKSIMEGRGLWLPYMEAGYQEYLKSGRFVYTENGGQLPANAQIGDNIPILPQKPYFEELKNIGGIITAETQKTAYFVLLKEHAQRFPILDDLRQRMELNEQEVTNPYIGKGLKKIHAAQALSAKKTLQTNIYDFRSNLNANGEYVRGQLNDIVTMDHNTRKLRFPQTVPSKEGKTETVFNRQSRKNTIANVKTDQFYFLNAGLEADPRNGVQETPMLGQDALNLYHSLIQEKIRRDLESVNDEIGLTKFRKIVEDIKNKTLSSKGKVRVGEIVKAEEFIQAKLELLKKIRSIIERQAIEREMSNNFLEALHITIDEVTGIPRFSIPLDFPVFGTKFQSAILSIYNNNVFKQKLQGYEAVQMSTLGGWATDEAAGIETLKFLEVVDHSYKVNGKELNNRGKRLAHAEIMVREDVLRKFGLPEGEYLLDELPEGIRRAFGYRIPNQDKSSMIIFKIKGILPSSYDKAILVPAQLVQLMGSDYDVDKMFLLFPELTKKARMSVNAAGQTEMYIDTVKVAADYNKILSGEQSIKSLSDAEVNNGILDIIEAVMSSPHHFLETLTPLDGVVLSNIRDELEVKIPSLQTADEWTGGTYETMSAFSNIMGVKLRGLWANALAGRNIATNMSFNVFDSFAIKIAGEPINTSILTDVDNPNAEYDYGVYTDKIISRYLSAAVDATKDPLQYVINDNTLTYPVSVFWINFHGDTQLLHHFLNQPIIREFVDIMHTKYNGNLQYMNAAYRAVMEKGEFSDAFLTANMPGNFKNIKETRTMSRNEIMNLSMNPVKALTNFMKMYTAGSQMKEVFKVIAPDTMDGLNRLESMQAYIERKDKFSNPTDNKVNKAPTAFYGRSMDENVVQQILDDDSVYGLSKGYYDAIYGTLEAASVISPIVTSEAVTKFKSAIKTLVAKDALASDIHRDLNSSIIFTMLAREDSPLRVYLDKAYSDEMYKPGKGKKTLWAQLKIALNKFPNLTANEFISKLQEDSNNEKTKGFKTFQFDATQQYAPEEKERIEDALETLIFRPEAYLGRISKKASKEEKETYVKNVTAIKDLGFKLAMHTLVSNGFKTTAYNYANLLPAAFYRMPISREAAELKPISIADYIHEQSAKMQRDSNYFDAEDLVRFFRIYGEIRPGGFNLAERQTIDATKPSNTFTVSASKFGGEVPTMIVVRGTENSDIFVLDPDTAAKQKLVYLSLRKTSNNKRHIVGGDYLNIKRVGKDTSIDTILGDLQVSLDAAEFKENNGDVSQICML